MSAANAIQKTPDGFTYLDPAKFHELFAADLPREQAEFEAHSQILTAAEVFTTAVTNPAWKLKPSWALVADADKIISPDLERMYAARAHSHVVEVRGGRLHRYSVPLSISGSPAGWLRNVPLSGRRTGRA